MPFRTGPGAAGDRVARPGGTYAAAGLTKIENDVAGAPDRRSRILRLHP